MTCGTCKYWDAPGAYKDFGYCNAIEDDSCRIVSIDATMAYTSGSYTGTALCTRSTFGCVLYSAKPSVRPQTPWSPCPRYHGYEERYNENGHLETRPAVSCGLDAVQNTRTTTLTELGVRSGDGDLE